MTIKYTKEGYIITQVGYTQVSVLHVFSPSLHSRCSISQLFAVYEKGGKEKNTRGVSLSMESLVLIGVTRYSPITE